MNRSTRLLLVVLVALIAAGVASFVVYRAIQRLPVRQVEVASVQTVVAARAIAVGAMVTRDDVRTIAWPARNPVPGSFTDATKVVNRGAIVAIAENEPITEAKLAPEGSGAGLPPTIPEGMRAISVRTNEVIGVAGFVVPGTRVDVLVTLREKEGGGPMSRVVVSNVQALTAGTRYDQEQARKDGKPIPTSVVTLLVTPEDAERIALAANEGQITLVLRNPLDVAPTETRGVGIASLMGAPAKAPVVQESPGRRVVRAAPAPAPEQTKIYTVEAIRAAKRTEEPVK